MFCTHNCIISSVVLSLSFMFISKGTAKSSLPKLKPEIRISKWISSSDTVEIKFIDEAGDWDGSSEWNDEIDIGAIHLTGFGTHEYIVSQHVAGMRVECRAQYPVEWIFHNAFYVTEDLVHGIQMKTFRHSKSVTNSQSDTFTSSLEILLESNKATGSYTCRGATQRTAYLSNNVFIFWEGNSPPYLVLSGKVLELEVDPSKIGPPVILPCYVSNPTASVRLYKELNGEFKELSTNLSKVSYNFGPKVGFQLTSQNSSKDFIGRYRCISGDVEENDFMEIVIRAKSISSKGIQNDATSCIGDAPCLTQEVSLGTRFYFDQNTEELICCGRKGESSKPTKLHLTFCGNPSICRMYEPAMFQISRGSGKDSMNGTCVSERLYPKDFGLVRCRGEGIDVFSYIYTEFWTPEAESLRAVFNWKDIDPQKMMHLIIQGSGQLYNRQLVTATCQTLQSYFSDGIKWAVKWQNGSLSYFDSILSTETNPRLHGIRSSFIRLNLFMKELICYAPVWNSTKWIEKRLKLRIEPSRVPTIVGDVVEEHTFSLNETDKILECVSDAQPPAKLKWTRNDEEIPRNMVIWNENGSSVLIFKSVSYQTQATYKCLARNDIESARKVFQIFVEDTRHSSWSLAFAIVIPLIVIAFVGIIAFLIWKMQLQRNVVQHLMRVVFREERS